MLSAGRLTDHRGIASQTFVSWNQIANWLCRLEAFRQEFERRYQPISVAMLNTSSLGDR